MSTTHNCDKCGATDCGITSVQLKLCYGREWESIDLCEPCLEELAGIISAWNRRKERKSR